MKKDLPKKESDALTNDILKAGANFTAPEGMLDSIMNKIEKEPIPSVHSYEPILKKKHFLFIAAAIAIFFVTGLIPQEPVIDFISDYDWTPIQSFIHQNHLEEIFSGFFTALFGVYTFYLMKFRSPSISSRINRRD